MTVISKVAGGLGLISSVREIHRNALIYSKRERATAIADTYLSKTLANQKTNRLSSKDADRKKWLARNDIIDNINECIGSANGYIKGVLNGIAIYFPQLILSGLAIGINKNHKVLANVCAAALAVVEASDFVKNSLSLDQRNDYLKIK